MTQQKRRRRTLKQSLRNTFRQIAPHRIALRYITNGTTAPIKRSLKRRFGTRVTRMTRHNYEKQTQTKTRTPQRVRRATPQPASTQTVLIWALPQVKDRFHWTSPTQIAATFTHGPEHPGGRLAQLMREKNPQLTECPPLPAIERAWRTAGLPRLHPPHLRRQQRRATQHVRGTR